jgi:hypothetical protein
MEERELKQALNELAEITAEGVRPGLAEDIKRHIPNRLMPHRGGLDTVNIIIDLRVSKLAAAAVIIVTMVLLASFFGGRDLTGESIYQDSKMLVKHFLGKTGTEKSDVGAARIKYEYLVNQGKDVVYYGDIIDPQDSNAVLMQWKLSDGRYKVIFGDFREREVGAEELIKLQTRMLQKRTK